MIASVSIRIIAGRFGGRRLQSRRAPGLRPTTDRVRESIFNILMSRFDFDQARVLDLFAGTGALGIEAISRGAVHCDFVEKNRGTAEVIGANLDLLGLRDSARVLVGDVIDMVATTSDRYDLILADPPYASTVFDALAGIIAARGLLVPRGLFVLEHPGHMRPSAPEGLESIAERSFGDTGIAVYRQSNTTHL